MDFAGVINATDLSTLRKEDNQSNLITRALYFLNLVGGEEAWEMFSGRPGKGKHPCYEMSVGWLT